VKKLGFYYVYQNLTEFSQILICCPFNRKKYTGYLSISYISFLHSIQYCPFLVFPGNNVQHVPTLQPSTNNIQNDNTLLFLHHYPTSYLSLHRYPTLTIFTPLFNYPTVTVYTSLFDSVNSLYTAIQLCNCLYPSIQLCNCL